MTASRSLFDDVLPQCPAARCSTRCGVGMGLLGLTQLLGDAGPARPAHAHADGRQPARAEEAALPGQGEARHPPLHQRRAVARRYVRPQAGCSTKYAGKPLPMHEPADRAQDRRRVPLAVQVPEVRPERHRGQRAVRAHRRAHRRHLRHPLDARRRAEPRAVAAADELRRAAADPAEHGLVGHLRPGHREPEPARLRRHVPRRLPDPGDAELAVRRSCRASTRARTSTRKHTDVEKLVEHVRNKRPRRPAQRQQLDLLAQAQRDAPGRTRPNDPQLEARIQSFELAYRMQMEATDAFDVSREPKHVRDAYGPGDAGPAAPDRPPAGRARRALRPGLARPGPAVGQPRRHRSQPPPARRAVRPGDRRR